MDYDVNVNCSEQRITIVWGWIATSIMKVAIILSTSCTPAKQRAKALAALPTFSLEGGYSP